MVRWLCRGWNGSKGTGFCLGVGHSSGTESSGVGAGGGVASTLCSGAGGPNGTLCSRTGDEAGVVVGEAVARLRIWAIWMYALVRREP